MRMQKKGYSGSLDREPRKACVTSTPSRPWVQTDPLSEFRKHTQCGLTTWAGPTCVAVAEYRWQLSVISLKWM